MNLPAWEQQLSVILRSKYTPSHDRIYQFQKIEEMVFEAVLELRAAGIATNAQLKKDMFDDNGFPKNLKTPSMIMLSNISSLTSYLSELFAFQTPPFGVTQDPAKLHVTTAVRDKLARDSSKGRWTLQLMKAVSNAVFFNYAPMRQWVDPITNTIQIRALDPYNTVVDTSVPFEELGSRGSYAYTVEMMSLATILTELAAFPANGLTSVGQMILDNASTVYNLTEEVLAQGSAYIQASGYVDYVNAFIASGGTNWATFGTPHEFDGLTPKRSKQVYIDGNKYAVTTYQLKALPDWLGLEPTRFNVTFDPRTGSVPVFKAMMLGPYVLGIMPESETLNRLSIAVGAVRMSGGSQLDVSYAELLMPYQIAATKLDAARYDSIRKMLGRTGVYNGDLIDSATLNQRFVKMKTGSKDGQTLMPQQAFMRDNIDGGALGTLIGQHGELAQLAATIVGNNPQMRGLRTPGNKLAGEAAMETTYAEAPFRVHAMVFQETLIAALREMLKLNLKYVLADLTFHDKISGERKVVSMNDLVDSSLSFEVSDGASPASKKVSPDAVGTLLGNLAQIPALQQLYDLRTLFSMFAAALGVPNIDSVPTPSVAQQQMMALAQAAGTGTGSVTANSAQTAQAGISNQAQSMQAQAASGQATQQAAAIQVANGTPVAAG